MHPSVKFVTAVQMKQLCSRFECVLEGESVLQAFQKANELKHVVGNLEFEDVMFA